MSEKQAKIAILTSMAAFFMIVIAYAAWKWTHFAYNGVDFAIFAQVFWNTVHGRPFAMSIHPQSYLGDHAAWIILALAPAYAVVQHPFTLLVIQALALSGSAWIVWRIARRSLPENWAVGVSIAFLLYPTLGHAALFEFHPLIFALPLLLLTAYFYTTKHFRLFVLFLILSLFVREDVSIVVALFGVVALIDRRAKKWILTPIISAGVWFFAMQKVIAYFSTSESYKFFAYYSWLWPLDFGKITSHFFTIPQAELLIGLLMPVLFLPLIRPKWLILAFLPWLQIALTNWGGGAVALQMHYAILFLPGLVLASIDGLSKLQKKPFIDLRLTTIIIGVAVIFSAIQLGPFFRGISVIKNAPNRSAYNELLQNIPDDASVAASFRALPYLAQRETLISFHYFFLGVTQYAHTAYTPEPPEYLLVDDEDLLHYYANFPSLSWTKDQYRDGFARMRDLITRENYSLIKQKEGLALWKRGVEQEAEEMLIPEFHTVAPNIGMAITHDPPAVHIMPSAIIEDDLLLKITTRSSDGEQSSQLVSFGFYPSFDWKPKKVISIQTKSEVYAAQLIQASGIVTLNDLGSTFVKWNRVTPVGDQLIFDPPPAPQP